MTDDLIERLQSAADAYPEDVFGKTTDEDRRAHGDVVQRAAATMGRHMAPLLREAAAALEAAREDSERWNELCRQIDAGEFHPSILDDAMNMGAGALEMHVDDAIDAAREARNG